MATQTTNLNLKKPALDDDALIADINNNMDTLDSTIGAPSTASAVDGASAFAKINSLNSKIDVFSTDYGSKTTSAFQTALETSGGSIDNGAFFTFKITLTDSVAPLTATTYVGICNKSTASRLTVILFRAGSTATPTFLGAKTSSGWSWNQIAIKDGVLVNGVSVKTIANKFVAIADTQFVLANRSLVTFQASVNNAWPRGVAYCTSVSDDVGNDDARAKVLTDVNDSPLANTAVLNSGTYYIAVKGNVSNASGCSVLVYSMPV